MPSVHLQGLAGGVWQELFGWNLTFFLIFCNVKSQGRRQSGVKFGKGGLTIYMEHSSEKLVGTKSKLARLGACLLLLYGHESWIMHLDSVMTLVVALTVVFREWCRKQMRRLAFFCLFGGERIWGASPMCRRIRIDIEWFASKPNRWWKSVVSQVWPCAKQFGRGWKAYIVDADPEMLLQFFLQETILESCVEGRCDWNESNSFEWENVFVCKYPHAGRMRKWDQLDFNGKLVPTKTNKKCRNKPKKDLMNDGLFPLFFY